MSGNGQLSYQMEKFLRSRKGRDFITSDPSVPAHSISPLMSIRNRSLFFSSEGPRTIGQVRAIVKETRPDLVL